jgi:NADH-quinone oxidoreductase subunit J
MSLYVAQLTTPDALVGTVLFYLFAAMAGGSAVAVAVSRNIVRTAVCLLFALVGVAGLYFLLDAEFLAAVQLVVYAGGTLILIVFGVMLTSRQQAPKMRPGRGEVVWLALVGFVLLEALTLSILHTRWQQNALAPANSVGEIGRNLLGEFLGPFELVSVLLLIAMLGAAYLARPKVPTQGPQHAKGTMVP